MAVGNLPSILATNQNPLLVDNLVTFLRAARSVDPMSPNREFTRNVSDRARCSCEQSDATPMTTGATATKDVTSRTMPSSHDLPRSVRMERGAEDAVGAALPCGERDSLVVWSGIS